MGLGDLLRLHGRAYVLGLGAAWRQELDWGRRSDGSVARTRDAKSAA
jgi:hypothetical protein